jgi:CheY-like chemotaxis protein
LLSLINDILDLSKVEAGKMLLDIDSVELAPLFANSLSIIREKAASRRIQLTLDAPGELGAVRVDGRKVKQIVYNMLANAVKFTSDGGTVTLESKRVDRADAGTQRRPAWNARSLPLAENEFSAFLRISVTDSGIGIAPDELAQLFKPFTQIDSGLARRFEGTGLGLAMVKLLAELHGGTVAVESAVGEGSCFTVWLPIRALDEVPRAATVPPVVPERAGDRALVALVVEDDFKSAGLIRVQLEAVGFSVLHAASAEAALVLAVQQPLSLSTLDIMLPNMDGWEFLTRIKQVDALKHIPVVIISIVSDTPKGYALGAAAVMQKPFSRSELRESLVALGLFPRAASARKLEVLVVDDDPAALELLDLQLAELAGSVLRASGGREAIEIARERIPDFIVLDMMMPDVSGFDVVEALKQDPTTAAIPIMIVTSRMVSAEDRARLSGYVTSIMEKSDFEPGQLAAEVKRAMVGRMAPA